MTDLLLEWFGYAASVVVAVSLLMNSLLRLRWINLFGSAMFSTYGFIIGAMPVFALNGFIVLINIYYLFQIYSRKEYFELLEVEDENLYLKSFLKHHETEIRRFIPNFSFEEQKPNENLFVLRNMQVVGVFLAHRHDATSLMVDLDFATPEYRDFKLANFVFAKQNSYFSGKGYTKLYSKGQSSVHNSYLRKTGFEETQMDGELCFVKKLS